MFPAKVFVSVVGAHEPGLAVRLQFRMIAKNDYLYTLFLDDSGKKVLSREELFAEFDQTAKFAIMDYQNIRGGFTGEILAHVISKEEIEAAISAYNQFRKHWAYPPDYLARLRAALAVNATSNCAVHVVQTGNDEAPQPYNSVPPSVVQSGPSGS